MSDKPTATTPDRRLFLSQLFAAGVSAAALATKASQAATALAPVNVANPFAAYPSRDWEKVYRDLYKSDSTFVWLCAPNDTHNCLLNAHVKNGVVTRISPTYGYGKAKDLDGKSASHRWDPRVCQKGLAMVRRRVCELLGWTRPIAFSGNVHQTEWRIALAPGEPSEAAEPPHRLQVESPAFGPWRVDAGLAHRPAGALPTLLVGPSPAYDLRERDASVARLAFRHQSLPQQLGGTPLDDGLRNPSAPLSARELLAILPRLGSRPAGSPADPEDRPRALR